jgi:sugar/nucleoside kinase (ribokinase family)
MRNGIIAAGNWIIDHVKIIDTWPERGMLANIKCEMTGTGGAPYNVLVGLAKMQAGLPLWAMGVIGNDADGQFILQDLRRNRIDTTSMMASDAAPTSYTDVMTEERTGTRTFFHCRGANAILEYKHFPGVQAPAKIFHLGYLLLLDKLDGEDAEFGVAAARVLAHLQQQGYRTSVDVVSEQSDRFKKVVIPCLPYVDYLIVNEIEAGATTGVPIRSGDGLIDSRNLLQAAQELFDSGVKELVAIHFPEGGYARTRNGQQCFEPSFLVAPDEIKGTAGAGDAFCTGMLYGLHEGRPLDQMLNLANANARFNLLSPTCTDGAVPLGQLETYIKSAQKRAAVVYW